MVAILSSFAQKHEANPASHFYQQEIGIKLYLSSLQTPDHRRVFTNRVIKKRLPTLQLLHLKSFIGHQAQSCDALLLFSFQN
jgi:hypothetical protein